MNFLDTPHGQQAVELLTGMTGRPDRCVEAELFAHNQKKCELCCDIRRYEQAENAVRLLYPHLLAGIAELVREHLRDQDATLSHRKARGVISTSVWEEGAKYAADYILSLRGR